MVVNKTMEERQKIIKLLEKQKLIKKKHLQMAPSSDLILGNVPELHKTEESTMSMKKKMHKDYVELQKEKETLHKLNPEERKEATRLLTIQKAIRKSEGEKIFSEHILKKSFKQRRKKRESRQNAGKKGIKRENGKIRKTKY